ncbi:MAG: TonB-dependent receptor, partial [Steroidobacteraceae bacterium]
MRLNHSVSAAVTAILGGCALCAAAAAANQVASAADDQSTASSQSAAPQSGTLETITVTAQRRSQNLQNVPISVTAFTSGQLATEQLTATVNLDTYVPNMFSANNVGQGSANVYYIRGLGQTQSFPTFEPQVGTYVDNIYIARQNANNFALFGVDSVQVLNGPQGTLFGRNSTGGAIVVTLKQPSQTFGGDVEASYGQAGDGLSDVYTAKADVDIPISQELLTRTSIYGITDNGYVDDLTTHQRLNGRNNFGVREALAVLPSASVRWDVAFDYERNNAANFLDQPGPGGTRISYSGFNVVGGALEPYLTGEKASFGQGAIVDSYGAASTLSLDIGSGTLQFISGYRGLHQEMGADYPAASLGNLPVADAVPTGEITLALDLKSHQVSQEIKWHDVAFDRLDYTSGVYFLYEQNGTDYGQVLGLGPAFALTLNDQYFRNDTTSIAAYTQGDYKITSALTFTLGGRFTNETKDVTAHPDQPGLGYDTAQIQGAGYPTSLATNQFTPRAALQYRLDPSLMVFASATRGFQGGGWNGLTGTNPGDFNSFRPESIWSYEAGWRSTPTDRLRFNTTFFYEDVKDDQLLYDNAHTDSFDTSNGASMYGYGVETDLEWRPIDPLTVNANISSMKAGFYDPTPLIVSQEVGCRGGVAADCDAGIVRANGALATPTYTPALDFTFSGSYVLHFGSVTVTPFVAVHFVGSEWFDNANTFGPATPYPGEGGMNPARMMLDASVTLAPS